MSGKSSPILMDANKEKVYTCIGLFILNVLNMRLRFIIRCCLPFVIW